MSLNEVLWIENGDGAARGHRACLIGRNRTKATIALLERGGDRREVAVAELTAAEPLTADEEREYERLDAELAGTIGEARKLRRFNALRIRSLIYPAGGTH
ncbi:MAG: hypothetical protein QOI38_2052 [Sphingomonadales bacterium]|jgi:hypothetical protein|nr:hypothetical protein [Sphingomonadales bacterium]